jgi:hypothetical protein
MVVCFDWSQQRLFKGWKAHDDDVLRVSPSLSLVGMFLPTFSCFKPSHDPINLCRCSLQSTVTDL